MIFGDDAPVSILTVPTFQMKTLPPSEKLCDTTWHISTEVYRYYHGCENLTSCFPLFIFFHSSKLFINRLNSVKLQIYLFSTDAGDQ
jgi:hypothetical protein